MHIQRADKPQLYDNFSVLIVEGPNNLLGRPVLQKLWSEQYQSLVNSAQQSLLALDSIEVSGVRDISLEDRYCVASLDDRDQSCSAQSRTLLYNTTDTVNTDDS